MWVSLRFPTSKINLQIFHLDSRLQGKQMDRHEGILQRLGIMIPFPFVLFLGGGKKPLPSQLYRVPTHQMPIRPTPPATQAKPYSPFLQMSVRSFTCRAGGHGSHHSCCVPACQPAQPPGNGQEAGWAGKGWGRWLLKLKPSC